MRVTASTKPNSSIHIVAISGGSCSGKTTLAKNILKQLGDSRCAILAQDSYYIDQSKRFDHDGGAVNFDHPSAIDFELLAQHLKNLKSGLDIQVPVYDFTTHSRLQQTLNIKSHSVILVDGILLLSQKKLLPLFDESIFIEAPTSLRLDRRLKRDVQERAREPEGIKEQFQNQVKPMHDQFVEPSKASATIVIKDELVLIQKKNNSEFQTQLIELVLKSL
jgi:uridine kinase